ncbi:MAG: SPOR domain-containing protein [Gammaproteobacteria bacterium]|nr:SPOR domain-containing protein [Gammaproteobacteria bacterium]
MAQRKRKRRSTRNRKKDDYPGWVWMFFGLAIGLSVAFAIYVNDREPVTEPVAVGSPEPASLQGSIDKNGETAALPAEEQKPADKRFTFYDILPNFEVTTPEAEVAAERQDSAPQAIEEPGVYVLQAGSFSAHADADRRRAELALHGIESHIQRVKVNDRNYHRVYIGPTDDLDNLNLLRSRLRAAKIDVLRIRLSD